jgi:tetratricopeptide (TPR) repeat protein
VATQKSADPTQFEGKKFRTERSMRDNVVPMLSSTQERMDEEKKPAADVPKKKQKEEPKPLRVHVQESVVAELAEEALESPVPEEALKQLEACVAEDHPAGEKVAAYAAMAQLQLRIMPPNPEAAEEAAQQAVEHAQTPGQKHRAAYVQVVLNQFRGNSEAALKAAEQALAQAPKATSCGLRLRNLAGAIASGLDQQERAEALYRSAMEDAVMLTDAASEENVLREYRLAGLKLARLLRSAGRDKDAAQVVREVEVRLADARSEYGAEDAGSAPEPGNDAAETALAAEESVAAANL